MSFEVVFNPLGEISLSTFLLEIPAHVLSSEWLSGCLLQLDVREDLSPGKF